MSRVLHLFLDVHMGAAHDTLKKILKKEAPNGLSGSETALFVSRDWCACKLLTADNVILYLRRPKSAPINPKAIRLLPNCVDGGELRYEKALGVVIRDEWQARYGKAAEDE